MVAAVGAICALPASASADYVAQPLADGFFWGVQSDGTYLYTVVHQGGGNDIRRFSVDGQDLGTTVGPNDGSDAGSWDVASDGTIFMSQGEGLWRIPWSGTPTKVATEAPNHDIESIAVSSTAVYVTVLERHGCNPNNCQRPPPVSTIHQLSLSGEPFAEWPYSEGERAPIPSLWATPSSAYMYAWDFYSPGVGQGIVSEAARYDSSGARGTVWRDFPSDTTGFEVAADGSVLLMEGAEGPEGGLGTRFKRYSEFAGGLLGEAFMSPVIWMASMATVGDRIFTVGGVGSPGLYEILPAGSGSGVGISCGKARFDWYSATGAKGFVKKGEQACYVLLSHAPSLEALNTTLGTPGATLTKTFGALIGRGLELMAEKKGAIRQELEKRFLKAGIKLGLSGWFSAIKTMIKLPLSSWDAVIQKGVEVSAKATNFVVVADAIRHRSGCFGLLVDVDRKTLKIDWAVKWARNHLVDPDGDWVFWHGVVFDRIEERFAQDEYVPRAVGLRCGENGAVEEHSKGPLVFAGAVTEVR